MIIGFTLRHQLSKSATMDLLTLLNFHLPPGSTVPTSSYLLEKSLGIDLNLTEKHYLCENCEIKIASVQEM